MPDLSALMTLIKTQMYISQHHTTPEELDSCTLCASHLLEVERKIRLYMEEPQVSPVMRPLTLEENLARARDAVENGPK